MDPLEAAAGALKIMTHNMVNAIEMNSVRKGYDPRDFVLVAAGGAGPLFACDIAEELNIPYVVIPPYPGISAAMGLLSTDITYEKVLTLWESLSHPDIEQIAKAFSDLENEAISALRADGISDDHIVLKRICDCRYVGQGYELRVDAPDGKIDEEWVKTVIDRFHQVHEREYASKFPDQEVMTINVRVIGIGLIKKHDRRRMNKEAIQKPMRIEYHPVYFWIKDQLQKLETAFYQRDEIPVGTVINGPAIIQQTDSTTALPPKVTATLDPYGNLVIDMRTKINEKADKI